MDTAVEMVKVFLVQYEFNGKKQMALYYDYIPNSVRKLRVVGELCPVDRIIELPPMFAALSAEDLWQKWEDGVWDETLGGKKQSEGDANIVERLARFDAIIRTSNQEGERDNAKALWKKYTGRDWHQ